MKEGRMFDWSDIRTFLAVMSEGSAAGAARMLGTNQTTVSRRIERLEAALSLRLFEAGARGAEPTENAHALLADAKAMDRAAQALGHRSEGLRRNLTGVIRITTTPGVTRHIAGLLRSFQESHPDVRFEIETGDTVLSLEDGEADIAFRSAKTLTGDDLIARKLIDHPWGFYASKSYIAKNGKPKSFDELSAHRLVLYSSRVAERLDSVAMAQIELGLGGEHFQVTSIEAMVSLLLEGEGAGMLPRSTGDLEPDLEFCFTQPGLSQRMWLVWTRQGEAVPHVSAFLRFCNGAVKDVVGRLPPEWSA
jgi:DNA-binding transcriptional LysR family regulator